MTGTRFGLRRYSGCNLHVYSPLPHHSPAFSREQRERTLLERLARTRLHVPEDQVEHADGIDKYGPWVWMSCGDCLWDWLANRPLMYTPLAEPLYRLHEHVHTPHDHPRRSYVLQPIKQAIAVQTARLSCFLDERWSTNVWRGRLAFKVSVQLPELSTEQTAALQLYLPEDLTLVWQPETRWRGPSVRATWTQRGSNEHFAFQHARDEVREVLGTLSGTAWDTPARLA